MSAARERGDPPPFEVPELDQENKFYFYAYQDLQSDRQIGMAVGPISWGSMNQYALRYQVEDFDKFNILIRALDDLYLEQSRK